MPKQYVYMRVGWGSLKVLETNSGPNSGPFPSCLVPLFQSESWCHLSYENEFLFMQIKLIFIRRVVH